MTLTRATLMTFTLVALAPPLSPAQEKKPVAQGPAVRQLKFERTAVPFGKLMGKPEAKSFADAKALEALVGAKVAAELAKQVDFAKEQIVYIGYQTGGPPFGELKHRLKQPGQETVIEFYVQEPPGDGPRGAALKLGAEFFAVPRGVTVRMEGAK